MRRQIEAHLPIALRPLADEIVEIGVRELADGLLLRPRIDHPNRTRLGRHLPHLDERDRVVLQIADREPQTGGTPQSAAQTAPKQATANPAWERVIHPDPVLLFRYSALTFNGHRIHYDQPFATKQEGYPGLIVHGPLLATLLVDLVRRKCPDAVLKTFTFRAVSPLFDTNDFTVCGTPSPDGKTIQLWARGHDGALAMEATATLA